jgi:serine/threonine protein phosphatase PrpC
MQGLAMTRSFGDNISKSVGVTHKPEMIKVKIDEKDKFILVASDGCGNLFQINKYCNLLLLFINNKN